MSEALLAKAGDEVLSFNAIHPDWKSSLGATIKSSAVLDALFADEFLSRKYVGQILRKQEIVDAASADLGEEDAVTFSALMRDAPRLTKLAGLVWYSSIISRSVHRENLEHLLKSFDIEEIKFAVRNREFAPDRLLGRIEMDRIDETVESTGVRLVFTWGMALPLFASGRVGLLFPKNTELLDKRENSQSKDIGRLLHAVAKFMNGQEQTGIQEVA